MKRLAFLPALALAAVGSASFASTQTVPVVLPAAHIYDSIPVPEETFSSPLAAAQHFARYNPESEGSSTMSLEAFPYGGPDGLILLFMVDGYADDSVRGEQWRVQLERVADGWRVTEAGRRVKCYRGSNPGSWRKGVCV